MMRMVCMFFGMAKEVKDHRVTILMSESELETIDRWAHDSKIKSRGEAIRQLINGAITVLPAAKVVRNYVVHTGPDSASTTVALWDLVSAFALSDENGDVGFQEPDPGYGDIFKFSGGDNEAAMDVLDFVLSGMKTSDLDPRESFVVDRMGAGHNDEAIGEILGVSERTVRTYIDMLMRKTGALNRDDLIDRATLAIDIAHPDGMWK